MLTVYHRIDPTFRDDKADALFCWQAGGFRKVAEYDTADLNVVYHVTQNFDDPWIKDKAVHPTAEVLAAGGCRSTSVGDIITDAEGGMWIVASLGFESLTEGN